MAEKDLSAELAGGALPDPAAVQPAAPAEPAPVAAPAQPDIPVRAPSLLEAFDKERAAKAAAAKPAEPAKPDAPAADAPAVEKPAAEAVKPPADAAKPAEPAKPAEDIKPEAPAPEPVKYDFDLPPELKADARKLDAFGALLNEAKLPAELGKEVGQKMLALHAESLREYDAFKVREQHQVFNTMLEGERTAVLADPILGGAGHVTAMTAIARARDALVSAHPPGTPEYQQDYVAYERYLAVTGSGDFLAHLRMLHNASRYVDEPQAAELPVHIKPPPTNGRAPKGNIYTHPSSQNMDK